MGIWVYYFMLKLGLFWAGSMSLDMPLNLLFALFVGFPLTRHSSCLIRRALSIPMGIALFYHDTFFPTPERLIELMPNLRGFSAGYLAELLTRLINPEYLLHGILGIVILLIAGRWLRLATWVIVGILALPTLKETVNRVEAEANPVSPKACADGKSTESTQKPVRLGEADLDATLSGFYQNESQRKVVFEQRLQGNALPFDIVFLHICSLAWDDIDALERESLFKPFDLVFNHFNSAASYSGPAAIRLLRSNCGQLPHKQLFSAPKEGCFLFDGLALEGFESQFVMNHDGHFGGFLENVRSRNEGGLNVAPSGFFGASSMLKSFDGTPIYSDFDVLSGWWNKRMASATPHVALYYNTISLHDGNIVKGHESESSTRTFPLRMHRLMDDIHQFIDLLDRSGRPVMIVMVSEHGAAIHGDKVQIQGMRELPSPAITQVPLAIRLVGLPTLKPGHQIISDRMISYLGMADLIRQLLHPAATGFSLEEMAAQLLETPLVSSNEDTTVMKVQDRFYLKEGANAWKDYR